MASERRIGSVTSKKYARILEATEKVMVEEGYAAVTSRSVAARAGINASLVHYYFPTLDDLFVELLRAGAEANLERLAKVLDSPQPLLGLWRMSTERRGVILLMELMAAANHRKALREQVVELSNQVLGMQLETLRRLLPEYGLDERSFPAELVAAAIQGVALLVVREEAFGLSTGHSVAFDAVEALLTELEERRAATLTKKRPRARRA